MKSYLKPSINVIELQLKENIAAVPTTVYKGSTRTNAAAKAQAYNIALGSGSGIADGTYDKASVL